jgi:hypothetical protein
MLFVSKAYSKQLCISVFSLSPASLSVEFDKSIKTEMIHLPFGKTRYGLR